MVASLKKVLMERDGMSADEADDSIERARERLFEMIESGDTCGAMDICEEEFGLEPDYLEELL